MTSQVVRTLEEKGLLTRTIHPTDTRARLLKLTPTGHEITQQAFTLVETADATFFESLTNHDTSTLLTLMQHLIQSHTTPP
jgi:DNA-binding MarR family transcriptional regulator